MRAFSVLTNKTHLFFPHRAVWSGSCGCWSCGSFISSSRGCHSYSCLVKVYITRKYETCELNNRFRCHCKSRRKYSLKEGNLALSTLDHAADEERDSVGRETEEKTELVEMVGSNESVEDEGKQTEDEEEEVEEEDGDDYFQDPTDICKYCGGKCAFFTHNSPVFTFPVPAIDPLPTERFPEYVRDMLYGEENKLKAEFSVRYPYMVILRLVYLR